MSDFLDLGRFDQTVMVFGGPYSNLQATRSLADKALEYGIANDHIICTGDLIAYCAEPQQTVDFIRHWGIYNVMGNCEESLALGTEDCGCGFESGSVCDTLSTSWYRHCLTHTDQDQRDWMASLPRQIRFQLMGRTFDIIHGGVSDISEFVFHSSDMEKKRKDIEFIQGDCVIGGHCGIPFGQEISGKYWLNAGVIGMPANDGQTNGWYMLLEPGTDDEGTPMIQVKWHPLHFDSQATIDAMDKAKLPTAYQQTLQNGLWPSLSVLPNSEVSQQGQALQLCDINIPSSGSMGIRPTPAHYEQADIRADLPLR